MDERDIGGLAQDEFSKWCSQAGIRCNPSSKKDLDGWDFVIEFDDFLESNKTYDEKPSRYKAYIQVKGSDDSENNRSIKLRNWEKMVIDSDPFFIVRIEFDNKIEPQRAFIIHVGDELISKALSKLRGITSENSILLSKKTIRYPKETKDMIHPLNGIELKRIIKSHVKGGMFRYTYRKQELVKNIGIEKEEFKFTFNVDELNYKNPNDFIIDLSLGKLDKVKVLKSSKKKTRFGIETEENLGPGFFKINKKPAGKCKVVIKNSNTLMKETIQMDYVIPSIDPKLIGYENFKILVKDNVLQLEIGNNNLNFGYTVSDYTADFKSHNYRNLFKILNIWMDYQNNGGKLELQFEFGPQKKRLNMSLNSKFKIPKELIDDICLLSNYFTVADNIGLEITDNKMIDDILNNQENLNVIGDLLKTKEKEIKIETKPNPDTEIFSTEYVMPFIIGGQIGNQLFTYSFYVKGRFEKMLINKKGEFIGVLESKYATLISKELKEVDINFDENLFINSFKDEVITHLRKKYKDCIIDLGVLGL